MVLRTAQADARVSAATTPTIPTASPDAREHAQPGSAASGPAVLSNEPDLQLPLLAEVGPLIVAPEAFCCFEVPGEPQAWGRPGATIRWGHGRPFIHWYVRTEEARYREQIAWCAKAAMRGRTPTRRPCALLVHVFLHIPESWHWRRKLEARAGALRPTGPPDWDNFGKLVDALKGILWEDDAAVVDGRVIKRFSETPALRIEVREFVPPL